MSFTFKLTQETIETMVKWIALAGAEFIPWFLKQCDEAGRAPSAETLQNKYLRIKGSDHYDSHYPDREE